MIMAGSCCLYFIYFSFSCHLSCELCVLPSAFCLLGSGFWVLRSAFCILHSHANTSHRLIALAMASAAFTGYFVLAVPPPLYPFYPLLHDPLKSLDFGSVFLHNARRVVQMKIKNTSGNFCLSPH